MELMLLVDQQQLALGLTFLELDLGQWEHGLIELVPDLAQLDSTLPQLDSTLPQLEAELEAEVAADLKCLNVQWDQVKDMDLT